MDRIAVGPWRTIIVINQLPPFGHVECLEIFQLLFCPWYSAVSLCHPFAETEVNVYVAPVGSRKGWFVEYLAVYVAHKESGAAVSH